MNYSDWYNGFCSSKNKIVQKLLDKEYDKKEIIDYFSFDNMIKSEVDFCLLYKDNKKCHDLEDLNCFFCACPHFKFDDDGLSSDGEKTTYSICSINSKDGSVFQYEDALHQDCSNCTIPHQKDYVLLNCDIVSKN